MKASHLFSLAGIALFAGVLLTGCSKGASQFAPPAGSATVGARNVGHRASPPPPCTPTLWASTLSNAVYGYTAANTAPCVTLNGTYNGLSFNAPAGVAIGTSPNRLYVADYGNNRIVVFNYNGVYLKWLNTSIGTGIHKPWGVCVSHQGTVGVANRGVGGSPNVEFFPPNAASGSMPTGYATGVLNSDLFCAFDNVGDFFVDGTVINDYRIAYLAKHWVGQTAQTLVDSGLGSAHSWTGMYSRIDSPPDRTLSVGFPHPGSTQTVDTWTVTGPAMGPLTFTPCACSPYSFTNYPHSRRDQVYQVAPSSGGASGFLYFADLGKGRVIQGPANGGPVTTYEHVPGVSGVATRPTGQY